MASNDPGIVSALSEDPIKGAVTGSNSGSLEEVDKPIAPDQFDERYETSKWEVWSYYAYYIGNNGLTLFNFGPTAAQNLVYQHAEAIGGPGNTIVRFAGANRTINSVILLCNGISFAIQCAIFLVLGSFADFGTFRPNILIVLSLIAWGIGFGWLGVHTVDDWQIGLGLYMVGLIAYQLCLTYWTAAFPGLARNTRVMRDKAREFESGDISREEYDHVDSMKRNELSNTAFYVQSVGELFILAVIVGIMFSLHVNASTANNNYGLSVLIAFASGVWLLLAIPWFVMEKRRPGQDPGMNIVLAGFWQLRRAVAEIWQLRQSLFYLIGNVLQYPVQKRLLTACLGYFLLGDSLNTTVTVIGTLQNEIVAYNTLQLTYLLIVGIAAQAAGIWIFWNVQKRYDLSTKTMFNAVAVGIILLDGWGMIGIWTQSFGFHNTWEVWVYQAFYGLFVCPWYSYSQTMISEVTPRGKEFLFFSLFSIIGKTSSFIGPFISSAIIDDTGNNSSPFYFLFALSLASFLFLLFFVDVKKSRIEQAEFLERERIAKEKLKGADSVSTLL
ncbi:probable autophagy protein (Atg22) [Ramularia collo-cygni]|uniref:Autophagy-related protein n=1 Tax=Ramularia collo-cygni TaxID=112498 RepID=A0A2D3UR00_9PEZI|nr:probable autophagy protein (Atg22) [Ramularia collo-cygni]CZT15835.1 probable autophagy protein (Atg22) [Ramularia collo-cygni]